MRFSSDRQIPTYNKLPLSLVRGEGVWVWDDDGRRYLDFYGGHCVTLLGHCPPRVVDAIRAQAEQLLFYSNLVDNPLRNQTADLLASMAPDGLGNIFFCNSGSEANEAALKLARKFTGRSGVIATQGAFHGRTLGSLAATWNPKYREPYLDVLAPAHFVPFGDVEAVDEQLRKEDDVAAVILEPIQSMAGIVEASAEYLANLRDVCDTHGVLLIFDEVQTGVGRTGTFSISEVLGVQPDLITMAKSLGSGVPVGAALVSDAIAETVAYGDQGTTFGGGMIAMAAVKATLETISEEELMSRASEIEHCIREVVGPLVEEVRGRGCLIGLKLAGSAAHVIKKLREEGILAGGSSDPAVIRLMPPLITTRDHIEQFAAKLESVLAVEAVN